MQRKWVKPVNGEAPPQPRPVGQPAVTPAWAGRGGPGGIPHGHAGGVGRGGAGGAGGVGGGDAKSRGLLSFTVGNLCEGVTEVNIGKLFGHAGRVMSIRECINPLQPFLKHLQSPCSPSTTTATTTKITTASSNKYSHYQAMPTIHLESFGIMAYRVCWTVYCPTVYLPCAVDSMPCLLDVVSVLADGTPILIDGIPCVVDRIFLGVGTCSWRCLISCIAPICRAAPSQGGQGVYSGLCKLCRGDKPRKVQVDVLIARWKQAVMEHGVY